MGPITNHGGSIYIKRCVYISLTWPSCSRRWSNSVLYRLCFFPVLINYLFGEYLHSSFSYHLLGFDSLINVPNSFSLNTKLQTKKSMESSIPYLVLGVLYAYLLYLSWTPETVRLIFASKYLLPELTSIGKMFSSELTLASAWIHLLVVDLFAARHVFQDGLENQIETRHSVSFCLFFCPIGILTHVITKAMTKTTRKEGHGL